LATVEPFFAVATVAPFGVLPALQPCVAAAGVPPEPLGPDALFGAAVAGALDAGAVEAAAFGDVVVVVALGVVVVGPLGVVVVVVAVAACGVEVVGPCGDEVVGPCEVVAPDVVDVGLCAAGAPPEWAGALGALAGAAAAFGGAGFFSSALTAMQPNASRTMEAINLFRETYRDSRVFM
jgi:hypothetical protein